MKIIFRGYGPTTKFKTVERIEEWANRPHYNDVIEINEVLYTISRIVARQNEIIVSIKPEHDIEGLSFDSAHWYQIADNALV
jgi:hypothetical protein